ncbi:hypothetical protein GZH47_01870 [Paenibacillus rhizovicinus]|uniref:Uncharacterized protein n=1 Tax=Paenibacillus rhizovicinus TaxID=2704463 RepID=A0A6C0NU13_9BACL|nr:hypothetical protein [Paenibacillus rhizovicinus]QHW29709.1 hypothetical protein GZH47_01870 [Paenibacillus rhizovicinus]
MPIYRPSNMQGGAGSSGIVLFNGNPPTIIMEWGHYITDSVSLLSIQGGALVGNSAVETIVVTFRILVDQSVVQEYSVRLAAGTYTSAFFGAEVLNADAGHRVCRITAQLTTGVSGDTAFISSRQVTSISGTGV